MDVLKQLLTYAFLLALVWAGITYLPRLSRVQLSVDYSEINVPGVEEYKSYSLDRAATIPMLRHGDAVCYRIAKGDDAMANGFGYVAGVPGDLVQITKGKVVVNGEVNRFSGDTLLAEVGPLIIPENHVYVVTTHHNTDSVARGPLPAAALRGRVGDFP
ncbi:MAG: hypothetical protein H0W83_04315 [Planctomycetes bacterium]|nr:hypothetical protein [Planctomycetota bacterium]